MIPTTRARRPRRLPTISANRDAMDTVLSGSDALSAREIQTALAALRRLEAEDAADTLRRTTAVIETAVARGDLDGALRAMAALRGMGQRPQDDGVGTRSRSRRDRSASDVAISTVSVDDVQLLETFLRPGSPPRLHVVLEIPLPALDLLRTADFLPRLRTVLAKAALRLLASTDTSLPSLPSPSATLKTARLYTADPPH